MKSFRILLVLIFTCILVYTGIVASNHGLGLLEIFFLDIAKMGWPGQFNVDFMSFLTLTALWLAWRHHFSPLGIVLGITVFFGGCLFLSMYLFILSFKTGGDAKELFLGKIRANN